uniref:Enhancer of mRNA-decapping protein 4 C-terminal domain-containing protein n=2 Tax=Arion vulgaris TaxID=1028688 RepID=A0A0B6ZAV0_9EUPU
MKYLEEAVLNLDTAHTMTADHIPNVLGALIQRLRVAEGLSTDARKSRTIRMLIMAASSLLT